MFENNTEDIIRERALGRVKSGVYKGEGGFVGDVISPVSLVLADAYIAMDSYLQMAFASTADMEHLELKAEELGVFKRLGMKSLGQVLFSGVAGTSIAIGTEVSTIGGLYYTIIENGVIGANGSVSLLAEAQEVGVHYNILSNNITQLSTQIIGVTSVTNPAGFTGGEDAESRDSLLQRYLFRVQNPASSGNVADYTGWAKEVQGVGNVRVLPTWNGGGTVKLVLIDSNKNVCNASLIKSVADYVETKRPIGAIVTVVSATAKPINISVNIVIDVSKNMSTLEVKSEIEKNIVEYLKSIAFNQDFISYAKVGNIIMGTVGVADYKDLSINGSLTNVAIGNVEVAVLGGVTLV